jgi:hypothetical protein
VERQIQTQLSTEANTVSQSLSEKWSERSFFQILHSIYFCRCIHSTESSVSWLRHTCLFRPHYNLLLSDRLFIVFKRVSSFVFYSLKFLSHDSLQFFHVLLQTSILRNFICTIFYKICRQFLSNTFPFTSVSSLLSAIGNKAG